MTKLSLLIQDLSECREKALVGGKAINLGQLIRAGFPVPGGFVVTTEAYRQFHAIDLRETGQALAEQIKAAWHALGGVPVAVRSSATAEDMAEASMAGQYDTFLDIADEESLLKAVQACWASLSSPRTHSYLAGHGIDLAAVAMAVVVQKLVPADVAGVMFGANPQTGSRSELLIEASWGLGESVVSGRVQPDVLRIDRATGKVLNATISDKQVYIRPGDHEEKSVEPERRKIACLNDDDITHLWQLCRRAEEHFGQPQDMEWAISAGQLFLLQSRPITTLEDAAAYEVLVQSTRSRLQAQLDAGRGPWVLHNIGETLKHPTPLTWSVIRRFMSGAGGFGELYRLAGFEPSERVCKEGFLQRIGGRVYMDLALAAEMFFTNFPFRYDLASLRNDADAGQAPPTVPCGTLMARLKAGRRIGKANGQLRQIASNFDKKLNEQVLPEYVAWCRQEKSLDLAGFSNADLIWLWGEREKRVMDEFAPRSLLPSLISAMALADLKSLIREHFWDEDAEALANLLAVSPAADKTMQANADLYEVSRGQISADQWLANYGHRAADEFDLATPRWRQRPAELENMARRLKDGPNPAGLHEQRVQESQRVLEEHSAKLATDDSRELKRRVELARRYIIFREDGKYYLMLGYDLLRDVAIEAGRRLATNGEGVFQLTAEEMFESLRLGFAPSRLIAQRKMLYEAETRLDLPAVIDVGAIAAIGGMGNLPMNSPSSDSTGLKPVPHQAFAVSSGVAVGPARIVHSPDQAGDLGKGYVLVCPSTDPGWTPLFVNAAALVLERGGTLSHGAVIAREMNIPAVVLSGATRIFRDGEKLIVDGRNGRVSRADEAQRNGAETGPSPDDVRIAPKLLPPPPGRKERRGARLRNIMSSAWCVYLVAAFLLPHRWLYGPTIAVLDAVLWPGVRKMGRPITVAVIAAVMAATTMLLQRWLTDNARLREAKRRAARLRRMARDLPLRSPRCNALLGLAGPVQVRIAAAALVPLAVILGPMVMVFVWLPQRVDPAVMSARPGSDVDITALVQSDYREPLTLSLSGPLAFKTGYGSTQKLQPIRETMLEMYKELGSASDIKPLAARVLAERSRESLKASMEGALPPQPCTWKIVCVDNAVGEFPVSLRVGNGLWLFNVVFGDRQPPSPTLIAGDSHLVLSIQLKYNAVSQDSPKAYFWHPFKPKSDWDPGWLLTYLVVYVPVMFGVKWGLRVA